MAEAMLGQDYVFADDVSDLRRDYFVRNQPQLEQVLDRTERSQILTVRQRNRFDRMSVSAQPVRLSSVELSVWKYNFNSHTNAMTVEQVLGPVGSMAHASAQAPDTFTSK